jgi:hypothetical protein
VPIEAALIKPVVDALMAAFQKARTSKLKSNARSELSVAIRELLLADPDQDRAKAAIAAARAAGIISDDLFLAKRMLKSVKRSKKPGRRKDARKPDKAKKSPDKQQR